MKKLNRTKLIRAAAAAGILLALGLSVSLKRSDDMPLLPPLEETVGMEAEPETKAEADAEENAEVRSEAHKETEADIKQETEKEAMLCVYVCGEVAVPGVYYLPEGARIYEAVEAAGGALPDAAEDALNLAQTAEDGMKVRVPSEKEVMEAGKVSGTAVPAGEAGASDPYISGAGTKEKYSGSPAGRVNINTAGKEELMTLPGIGAGRAEKIIEWRTAHGGFRSEKDIMKVSGIKEKAYEKLKDRITV